MAPSAKDVEEGKVVAVLAYIVWIVGIIWYFADEKMKKNSFAKFHIKQSIVLVITMVILWIAMLILTFILAITVVGLVLVPILWFLIWILILIWVIMGLISAINGTEKELFLIGGFAKHLTF